MSIKFNSFTEYNLKLLLIVSITKLTHFVVNCHAMFIELQIAKKCISTKLSGVKYEKKTKGWLVSRHRASAHH